MKVKDQRVKLKKRSEGRWLNKEGGYEGGKNC